MVQQKFHNSVEGVVPDEEEHGEFPPFQGETVTQWGEGSSSAWSAEPSSWEDPRTSVYTPEAPYDPWTYQYPLELEEAPGDHDTVKNIVLSLLVGYPKCKVRSRVATSFPSVKIPRLSNQ